MAAVCDAANVVADAEAASEAYELLVPFATLPVLVGPGVGVLRLGAPPARHRCAHVRQHRPRVRPPRRAVAANLALGNLPADVVSLATAADLLTHRNHVVIGEGRAAASNGRPARFGMRD